MIRRSSASEDLIAQRRIQDALDAYAKATITDMGDIHGQEAAKRALEIAATGNHTVTIDGPDLDVRHLTTAFSSIAGDPRRIVPKDGEIRIVINPTSAADLILAPPTASTTRMLERITAASRRLDGVGDEVVDYQLDQAGEALWKAAIEKDARFCRDAVLSVARSIAALDGAPAIGRLQIAESLSYQPERPF